MFFSKLLLRVYIPEKVRFLTAYLFDQTLADKPFQNREHRSYGDIPGDLLEDLSAARLSSLPKSIQYIVLQMAEDFSMSVLYWHHADLHVHNILHHVECQAGSASLIKDRAPFFQMYSGWRVELKYKIILSNNIPG